MRRTAPHRSDAWRVTVVEGGFPDARLPTPDSQPDALSAPRQAGGGRRISTLPRMDDLTLARTAAARAAGIIARWRGRIDGAEYKGNVDPVTAADRQADAATAALIPEHRPGH